MEEFEIDWIPEDTGAPYEADECFNDVPAHTIDKICKSKYESVGFNLIQKAMGVSPLSLAV